MSLDRVLSFGWLLLGAGVIATDVHDALVKTGGSILEGLESWITTGIVPVMLGLLLRARSARLRVMRNFLGYPVAIVSLLYAIYMFLLVLGETGLHPFLAVFVYVAVLSIGTLVLLVGEWLRTA